ncbi:MAG: cell division protein ZapA [Flavobacteriales bacterium]
MSDNLKIKIAIADRIYPLAIDSAQEGGLRKAGKAVNEMIGTFERSYAVRDKQDALAMAAFQLASRIELNEIQNQNKDVELIARLEKLQLSMSKHNRET